MAPTVMMGGKHDLVDFKDVDLDGSACRIGIVKVRRRRACRVWAGRSVGGSTPRAQFI